VRRLASLALCLLLSTPALVATGASAAAARGAARPEFAGLVDVGGGRRLYLECRGAGGPTVVLESGYRNRADVWSDPAMLAAGAGGTPVLPGIAGFTRVCAYDRPGTATVVDGKIRPSRSDPVPMPRTTAAIVDDLHALLRAAGEPGPYVLAGHSLGGLLVRLYASTYPDEVAGLVLVDALYERIRAHMPPAQWAASVRYNLRAPSPLDRYPDLERVDFDVAVDQMARAAAARPPRPVPLVVLTKGRPFGLPSTPGVTAAAVERAWRLAQDELPELSPCASHVVAASSDHYIQLHQPRLVVEAVRQVVGAVRDRAPCARGAPAALPATG
jgi:pimeloyl-ACP methyl ester carboxylesterase